MDTKKLDERARIYDNQLWTVPARPSRWRNVLEAAAEAAARARNQHGVTGNILDHARLHGRRTGK